MVSSVGRRRHVAGPVAVVMVAVVVASLGMATQVGAVGGAEELMASGLVATRSYAPPGNDPAPLIRIEAKATPSGSHYLIPLAVGEPPQVVDVIVDTASPALIIFDVTYCLESEALAGVVHPRCYNTTASQTGISLEYLSPFNFGLAVDGEFPQVRVSEHSDIIRLWINDNVTETAALPTFYRATGEVGHLPYWNETSGSFGILADESFPNAFRDLLLQEDQDHRFFAFDWNPVPVGGNGTGSAIHVGGYERASDLVWSEAVTLDFTTRDYFTFPLYHLDVCGVDLTANYSSFWVALIDTGASCLTLPEEFFEAMMAWLPVDCEHGNAPEDAAKPTRCYVRDGVDNNMLPSFSFRLGEYSRAFHVPLASLVMEEPGPEARRYLCVVSGTPLGNYGSENPMAGNTRSTIVFGAKVVETLYTVLDYDLNRVAFAPKFAEMPRDECMAPAECLGEQRYYEPLNLCQRPICYFFRVPSDHDQICRYSPGYLVVMAVVLLTLAVFEYIQFAMYERVTGTIAAALPPSDVTWDGARDAFAAPAADESDAFDFEAAGVPLEALG